MKKIIAMLLCLSILLSLCTVAFAASGSTINYVALGDSTSMGFFLDDYDSYYRHDEGYGTSSRYSDYHLLLNYLNWIYGQANVHGQDLTMVGMRPAELRAILDEAFYDSRKDAPNDNYLATHMAAYIKSYGEDYNTLQNTYINALSEADVITYDLMMIDFSVYLGGLIMADISAQEVHNRYAELLGDTAFAGLSQSADALRSSLECLLGSTGLPAVALSNIIDTLLYTYAQFAVNFSDTVDWIYSENPDVDLIVVGPHNPLSIVSVSVNGITINIGKLWDCMAESLIAYVVNLAPHAGWYRFTDCSGVGESCLEAFADGALFHADSTVSAPYSKFRAQLAEQCNDYFGDGCNINFETDFTPEQLEIINANVSAACGDFPIDGQTLMSYVTTSVYSTPENCKAAAMCALFAGIDRSFAGAEHEQNYKDTVPGAAEHAALAYFFGSMSAGSGIHPSAACCVAKGDRIIASYRAIYTARTTYLTRAIQTIQHLITNTLGAMLGSGAAHANLTAFFTRLFTPIIDLQALLHTLLNR